MNHSRMIDRIKITETMIMAEFEELLLTSPENFSESTKGTAKIAAELIKDIVNITQNLNLKGPRFLIKNLSISTSIRSHA